MTSWNVSTRSKFSLVIGISFLAGLVFGVFTVISIQNFGPQNEHETRDIVSNEVQQSSTNSTNGTPIVGTFVDGKFEDIFTHRNVFEQNHALYSTLSSASEDELRDWWTQSLKIERKSYRELAQDTILRHLTAKNPQEALRYIEDVSIFQVDGLLNSVFSEWSVSQLDEAVEVATNLSVRHRKVALQAILKTRDDLSEGERRSIAKQLQGEQTYLKFVSDTKASRSIVEPKESWDTLLNDEVDDYLQIESLEVVAEAWREHVGFEVLSKIYSQIEDYRSRLQLVEAIALVNPASALDYTSGLADEDEKTTLSYVIARAWVKTDAHAALAAVSTFTPASLASDLERDIAGTWASTNPNELIENIGTISKDSRLLPLEIAFSEIARKDPLEALTKVSSVETYVGNTSTILESIVRVWSRQKPKTAVDWVLNNFDQQDPQRHSLLEWVLPSLALQDPNQAFELALKHPDPTGNSGLDYLVIRAIARDGDIEVAMKFIPQVHANSRALVFDAIGRALVRKSQPLKALELGKKLEEQEQQIHYQIILNTWLSTNPRNLYESLETLPTDSLKSLAAKQLIMNNRYTPAFDDDEIEHARTLLNDEDKTNLKRIEN